MSLKGFEMETAPLTDYEEKTLLPIVVRGLATKRGKASAVKNTYICQKLRAAGYDITEARLRKLVNHIRIKGIIPCLIATSAGYYITRDVQEMDDYIESLYGRENAIRAVREAMMEQRMEMA